MADFDPDAYLASKTQSKDAPPGNFDPDAYLASKETQQPKRKTPLSWYEKAKEANESGDPKKAGLAQGGRIVDAVKQAFDDVKGKNGVVAAMPGVGAAETGLNAVSGVGSSIVGGLSGLGSMAKQGIQNQMDKGLHIPTREEFDSALEGASDTTKAVQQAGTYQPRTGTGKLGSELLSVPLNAASEASRSIGGDVGAAVGNRAAGEEIGGALPAVASTVAGGAGALKSAQKIANLPHDAVPGKDFSVLRDLTPEQQARYKKLISTGESAPGKGDGIKPTLGQITRDPEQWRFEEQQGAQAGKAGDALRDRQEQTNATLLKAINDADKGIKGGAITKTVEQTGKNLSSTLEKKAQVAKSNINSLYEKARQSGETKQAVNSSDLEKYIDDEAEEHPSLKVIQNKLQKLKEKNGGKLTVDDAETLYRTASDQTTYGDPSSVYMGRVKQRINDMTAGAGGDLYRDARNARLAYGMEFEDRSGIARLIEKKAGSRTDYRTQTEDVFKKTMINGSDEELKDVIRSLKDIDLKKDTSGAQALRNLQRQTVDYIFDKAANTVGDKKVVSAPNLEKAIDSIGRPKLDELLGQKATDKLYANLEAAKIAKDKPGRVAGSDTIQNARDLIGGMVLDEGKKHLIGSVPVVGPILKGLSELGKGRAAEEAVNARANEALNPRKASSETVKKMVDDLQRKNGKEVKNNLAEMAKKSTPAAASGSQSANKLRDYAGDE